MKDTGIPFWYSNAVRYLASLFRIWYKAKGKALDGECVHLRAAYIAANRDPDRRTVIEDWNGLDLEGFDE